MISNANPPFEANNQATIKSASEENLANLEVKAKKPNLVKKTSESSDPICAGTNTKWSYTNGRIMILIMLFLLLFVKRLILECLKNSILDNPRLK